MYTCNKKEYKDAYMFYFFHDTKWIVASKANVITCAQTETYCLFTPIIDNCIIIHLMISIWHLI